MVPYDFLICYASKRKNNILQFGVFSSCTVFLVCLSKFFALFSRTPAKNKDLIKKIIIIFRFNNNLRLTKHTKLIKFRAANKPEEKQKNIQLFSTHCDVMSQIKLSSLIDSRFCN